MHCQTTEAKGLPSALVGGERVTGIASGQIVYAQISAQIHAQLYAHTTPPGNSRYRSAVYSCRTSCQDPDLSKECHAGTVSESNTCSVRLASGAGGS